MPSNDEIRATLERYVKLMSDGDADGIAALYAEDATLEDPIGGPLVRGREAIRDWYRKSAGVVKLAITGPVRACRTEAATPMQGRIAGDGQTSVIDIVDVMAFDEEGRITAMRAFWSPEAIRVEKG